MKPIDAAIVLLQLARDQIDTEMQHRGVAYMPQMTADVEDLSHVAEDIGGLLFTLESFGSAKAMTHEELAAMLRDEQEQLADAKEGFE